MPPKSIGFPALAGRLTKSHKLGFPYFAAKD
jgi:hypothetical protein